MSENPLQPVDRATVLSFTRLPRRPEGPTVLDMLDGVSLLMDRLFQIPGTRMRFGLNSILMMIPVLGDSIPLCNAAKDNAVTSAILSLTTSQPNGAFVEATLNANVGATNTNIVDTSANPAVSRHTAEKGVA